MALRPLKAFNDTFQSRERHRTKIFENSDTVNSTSCENEVWYNPSVLSPKAASPAILSPCILCSRRIIRPASKNCSKKRTRKSKLPREFFLSQFVKILCE
uniref:Uncharacterized protein n=1 Tax=Romanomermis culicivorax TaxID=13658 RepID=A0A915K242_ROMCU